MAKGFCTCKRDFPHRDDFHPPANATWHFLCDKPVLGPALGLTGPACDCPPDFRRHALNCPVAPGQEQPPRIVPTGTGWPKDEDVARRAGRLMMRRPVRTAGPPEYDPDGTEGSRWRASPGLVCSMEDFAAADDPGKLIGFEVDE